MHTRPGGRPISPGCAGPTHTMNGYSRTRGVLSGLCLAAVLLGLTIGFTLLPGVARAQSVVNPTTLQFTASPDHNTVTNGTPVVSGYTLSFYDVGSTTALASYNLGKPTPDASNVITINLTSVVTTWPPSGVTYEARVVAVGPGGSAPSTPSNSFTTSGGTTDCTLHPRVSFSVDWIGRVEWVSQRDRGCRMHLDGEEQHDLADRDCRCQWIRRRLGLVFSAGEYIDVIPLWHAHGRWENLHRHSSWRELFVHGVANDSVAGRGGYYRQHGFCDDNDWVHLDRE